MTTVSQSIIITEIAKVNPTGAAPQIALAGCFAAKGVDMRIKQLKWICAVLAALGVGTKIDAHAQDTTEFRVGAADTDITPPQGIPMWGYG
ncbi:MAG TPA: hypothetical protein VHS97_24925, partial [Isosphaeraceae bacterium]|nr:hypothetical protein [Isosphaeraceae bacterium]